MKNEDSVDPGDILQAAMWVSGEETDEQIARFVEDEMSPSLLASAQASHVRLHGVLRVSFFKPGDDHVPPVPPEVHGPEVQLLVVEALVVSYTLDGVQSFFTQDLEKPILAQLRNITRSAYAEMSPGHPRLKDEQCDTIINDLGPDVAAESLSTGTVNLRQVWH